MLGEITWCDIAGAGGVVGGWCGGALVCRWCGGQVVWW